MLRRRLLVAMAALPAAGCVPAPYGAYFLPSSDAPARLGRAWCQGQAGPVTRIEQTVAGGTALTATVERKPTASGADGWRLHLRLDLAPDSHYRFAGDALRFTALDGGRRIEAAVAVRIRRQVTLPAQATVDPRALHPTAGVVLNPAGPDLPITRLELVGPVGFAPQRVRLDTPGVLAGGRVAALDAIVMQRLPERSARTFYREPALHERLEACRAAPTAGDCARLLHQGFASFERSDGPVSWQGQWDHFENRYDRRPVHGRIDVRVAGLMAWHWVDGAFKLTDLETGASYALETRPQRVEFDDAVTLSTPLRPPPRGTEARSALWVEADLPASVPSFELAWPALLVDDRRFELAPIRFERRAFDGGIEPFNC